MGQPVGRLIPSSANSEVLAHPASSEAPRNTKSKETSKQQLKTTERKDEEETFL